MQQINDNELISVINKVQQKQSKDIKELSVRFLHNHMQYTRKLLHSTHIFNQSIQKGIFPNGMKTSKTVPNFKSIDSRLDFIYDFINGLLPDLYNNTWIRNREIEEILTTLSSQGFTIIH